MADNDKYIARIPIVLDEFKNKNNHQNHELVVDIDNEDLYIKMVMDISILLVKLESKLRRFRMDLLLFM